MRPDRRTNMTNLKVAFPKFRKRQKCDKAKYHIKHTTQSTVYCYIKFGTHLQNGDVIVGGDRVVTSVIIAGYHIVDSSARSMVCGACSYCEIVSRHPIHKKILKSVLRLVLREHKIKNFLQHLKNCIIHI